MKEREQKSGGAGCVVMGVIAFLVPVLYVLGIGPAALLAKNYPSTENWLGVIYYPLGLAAEQFPQVDEALMSYMRLWRA